MRLKLTLSLFFCLFFISQSYGGPIVLKQINGQQIPFNSLKGKWVFINYWASWCQPCLDEIKELNAFYQSQKEKIALFAVNYDMLPLDEQQGLIRKYQIKYPSLQNDPASALGLGDIRGVPATFVFNPQGVLSTILYGGQTLHKLNAAMDS